jgi:hypothetical protein
MYAAGKGDRAVAEAQAKGAKVDFSTPGTPHPVLCGFQQL